MTAPTPLGFGAFSRHSKRMTINTPLDPPKDIADVDKRLRSIFLKNGIGLAFILLVMPAALIPIQWKLSHLFPTAFGYQSMGQNATSTPRAFYPGTNADCTHVFSSMPSIAIDVLSAGLIMFLFWKGICKINNLLLGYARSFAERKQWADVGTVLESFNQNGQHLLDTTGEAHYLLSIALKRIGKPQAAQKARDFVLNRKGRTEWAQRLLSEGQTSPAARAKRRRY